MATKNNNSIKRVFSLENAIDTFSFANTLALTTTEKVLDKGFSLIEKGQSTSDKYLKRGLVFSAEKQEATFDILDKSKAKSLIALKKVQKNFGLN